jgi:hypothetical protein
MAWDRLKKQVSTTHDEIFEVEKYLLINDINALELDHVMPTYQPRIEAGRPSEKNRRRVT